MARYTGPKWRISRRENADVFGNDKWRKRPTMPGQFPVTRGRGSNYKIQFREKQKVKRMYGMLERQFVRFYKQATKSTGNTGTRLLQLLEMRADNIIYRLGLAQTRNQARQFVTHGHVLLNGKKHNIPSTILKPGDEIQISPKLAKKDVMAVIKEDNKHVKTPTWLTATKDGGKVVAEPTRDEMDQSIRENLIIELYSR